MQLLHADYKITSATRLGQKCGGFQNQEYDPSQMPYLFSMVLKRVLKIVLPATENAQTTENAQSIGHIKMESSLNLSLMHVHTDAVGLPGM